MKDINHKFDIGDIVYAILDIKDKVLIENYIVTGVKLTPRFGYPVSNSIGLVENQLIYYELYPVVKQSFKTNTEEPKEEIKYTINPIERVIILNANRVYGSVEDLLAELKETAQ